MLQDELQPLYIFRSENGGMNIDIVKLDVYEFSGGMDLKRMGIIGSNQEQVSIVVWEHVVIYPLNSSSGYNIYQFKESMFVFGQ